MHLMGDNCFWIFQLFMCQSVRNSEHFFFYKNGTNFKRRELSEAEGNKKKMQMTKLILGVWENAWVSANSVCVCGNPYHFDYSLILLVLWYY